MSVCVGTCICVYTYVSVCVCEYACADECVSVHVCPSVHACAYCTHVFRIGPSMHRASATHPPPIIRQAPSLTPNSHAASTPSNTQHAPSNHPAGTHQASSKHLASLFRAPGEHPASTKQTHSKHPASTEHCLCIYRVICHAYTVRPGFAKADSTQRSSQAVPHPSTNRALCRLTSEVRRDPVHSTRYGRQREV